MQQRVDHRAVIGAMACCLDNHVACESEMVTQRVKLLPGCVAGRVFALRCISILRTRTEHMAMRVNSATRHLEVGLRGTFIPVKPSRTLLEGSGNRFRHACSLIRQSRDERTGFMPQPRLGASASTEVR